MRSQFSVDKVTKHRNLVLSTELIKLIKASVKNSKADVVSWPAIRNSAFEVSLQNFTVANLPYQLSSLPHDAAAKFLRIDLEKLRTILIQGQEKFSRSSVAKFSCSLINIHVSCSNNNLTGISLMTETSRVGE